MQVGVDEDDDIAAGDGHLVAEIARQGEDPHAHIGVLEFPQDVQRGIEAAVVNVGEFKVELGNRFETGCRRRGNRRGRRPYPRAY